MRHTITGRGPGKQARIGPATRRQGGYGFHLPRLAPAVLLLLFSGPAGAADEFDAGPGVTAWIPSGHAAARLLAAGPGGSDPQGAEQAGVEIRLDPGTITYWRNPGEAGLPPSFDFSGSSNVAGVSVAYPAPRRLDEDGEPANGYTDSVTFPLRVTRADPKRPAVLTLKLDYGVCEKLCLPAKAEASLPLPEAPVPTVAEKLAAAEGQVPRPESPGAPGPLAVLGASPAQGEPAVDVATRAGPGASLFVEAPEGWFLQPGEGTASGPGQSRFRVAVLQKPEGATLEGLQLRLTLVDASGAVDVPVRVDGTGRKP